MSEQWNTDLFKFLVWLGRRTSPQFFNEVREHADQYRKKHPLKGVLPKRSKLKTQSSGRKAK